MERNCAFCTFFHPGRERLCSVFPRMPEDEMRSLVRCCAFIEAVPSMLRDDNLEARLLWKTKPPD